MRSSRKIPIVLLAALVGACASGAIPPPAPLADERPQPSIVTAPAAAGRAVTSLAEIAGEWDIVEFDGHRPARLDADGQRHSYVDVGPAGLRFTIGCNYSGMSGSIGAGGVLVPANPDNGMQTEMGCGPEREARDEAFFKFFRSRPQLEWLPDGRLRVDGPHHSLLLETAETRRRAFAPPLAEIIGTWRVVSFTRFLNGGYQGWGAMFAPGRVRIDAATIGYSRCPEAKVSFRYSADFTLSRQSPDEMPSGACAGADPPATEVEPMVARLLGQSPHAERVPGGRYVLRSRDYAMLLASEEDYRRQFGEEALKWERRPG